jgi:hypothetical protein
MEQLRQGEGEDRRNRDPQAQGKLHPMLTNPIRGYQDAAWPAHFVGPGSHCINKAR